MKDTTAGTSQPKNTKNFNHDQLYKALLDVRDLLERCVVPMILLGETSRCAWDDKNLGGQEIVVGIKKMEYSDLVKRTLKSLRPSGVLEDTEFRYLVDDVPVRIKVIQRRYEFMQNLDRKYYLYDEYLFPNPFEKYFKARYIVQ